MNIRLDRRTVLVNKLAGRIHGRVTVTAQLGTEHIDDDLLLHCRNAA